MTRTCPVAVLSAILLVGSAFGQNPTQAPAPASAPAPLGGPVLPAEVPVPSAGPPLPLDCSAPESGPYRLYGDVDYLLGWVKGDRLPALITTSPAGTPASIAGTLGNGAPTTVVYGNGPVNTQMRSGIRANLAGYIDPDGVYAIELGFFALESQASSFLQSGDGMSMTVARPYIDVTTGLPAAVQIATPNPANGATSQSGSVHVVEAARNLWGWNLDLRESWINKPWMRVDALLGYRALRYDEHLNINQTISPVGGAFASGTTVTSGDSFASRNIFNGLDLGFRSEFYYHSLSLETWGKVAVGVLDRTSFINGSTTVNVPGSSPTVTPGGVLTQSGNIGTHTGHTDTGVPEVGFNLGWQITDNIRFRVGYTVLWWMNLVRPGSQIDTALNPGLFGNGTAASGTVAHPLVTGAYSDLWVQAVNVGLEVRY